MVMGMLWGQFSFRFGFVALLCIIISFQTFSNLVGSLRDPQWRKISKIMVTFIFVLPNYSCARTDPTPVPWLGNELFPRDSSHRSEADQPNPPTAEVNVCR
jgi:hypothetical protein